MFLIGHAAVGVMLASAAPPEPVVAFGIGWLSHYLADFVPHGDEAVGEWTKRGHAIKRTAVLAGIDFIVVAIVLLGYFFSHGFASWVLAAAIGSIVPDVLWGLEMVAKRKLFGPHHAFHHRNHNFFGVKMSLAVGLTVQFLVTVFIWDKIIG